VFRQRIERSASAARQRRSEARGPAHLWRSRADRHEKIGAFRRSPAEEAGVDAFFASLDERVADESVDALTRDTLRWYVHEERDSRQLLRAAYARVEAEGHGGAEPRA
jgi:hypothetical protein